MRNILYWSFLILAAILLAYGVPFGLYHLAFIAGAAVVVGLYFLMFAPPRPRWGAASVFLYVAVFWTTIGVFSNVKERREFLARYEPYVHDGAVKGFTFYYVDYPGTYERIDSAALNKLLDEKRPERVRMVVEIVRDFGRLRAYTVRSVESIPVDQEWTSGKPPWDALRKR
jgi:predicted membrane channel-forming protein YqfA (hemolysin III family)